MPDPSSMPLLKIAIYPEDEKMLRDRCRPVVKVTPRLQRLIDDMAETMQDAAGVGLAAPQVFVNQRFFIYEWNDRVDALINPEVLEVEGEASEEEGCLSLPRLQGKVVRPTRALVSGVNRRGRRVRIDAEDYLARIFLHEIDHLNGVLFIDKADRTSLHWLTEEEEKERVARVHEVLEKRRRGEPVDVDPRGAG